MVRGPRADVGIGITVKPLVVLCVLVASLLAWSPVRAQQPSPPATTAAPAASTATPSTSPSAPVAATPGQTSLAGGAVIPPSIAYSVPVEYPKDGLARHLEAVVFLEVDIAASGDVEAVRSVRQEGGEDIDFAAFAIDALKHFRFEPARENGNPIAVTIPYKYTFKLPALGRLAGLVVAAQTQHPVGGARVIATMPFEGRWLKSEATTTADGHFTIADLPPGDWKVQARLEGFRRATTRVQVMAEQVATVSLALEPPATGEYDILVEEQEDRADNARVYVDPTSVMPNTPQVSGVALIDTTGRHGGGFGGGFGGRGFGGRGGAPPGGFGGGAPPGGFGGGAPPGGFAGGGVGAGRFGGGFGAAATATETSAGEDVVSAVTQQAGIDLRGQNPMNTRIVLDGVDVPLAYHYDAIRPIVPAALIDSASFYPGSFPIKYGDATAGLIVLRTNSDLAKTVSGYVDANWADTSAMLRVPLSNEMSVSLSGQYSTLDRVMSDVVPHDSNIALGGLPRYSDLEFKWVWHPNPATKVQVLALGSQDQLVDWFVNPALGDPPAGTAALSERFYRVILTTESKVSQAIQIKVVAGGGRDENLQYSPSFDVKSSTLQIRPNLDWKMGDSFALNVGLQYVAEQLDGSVSAAALPSTASAGRAAAVTVPQTVANILGGYAGAKWRWFDGFDFLPGLRFEHFSQTGETIGDPRVEARWRIVQNQPAIAGLTLKASVGEYHQPPSLLQTSAAVGNPSLDSENSAQYLGGVEYRPTKELLIDVSGFYVSLSNVIVDSTVVTRTSGRPPVPQVFSNNGSGETRGVELFVQQDLWNNLEGWFYYTFSVSDLSTNGGPGVLSPYDQTNVLGTMLSYTLPEQWRLRGRFQYATGFPTTAVIGSVFDSSTASYVSIPGATLGARTPAFSQLDLRVDKAWKTAMGKLSAYVDVRNVYNRANLVTPYAYSEDYSQKYARYGLPVLPMAGGRLDF